MKVIYLKLFYYQDGVPDDLYVAFEECHLGEENKDASNLVKNTNAPKLPSGGSLAYPGMYFLALPFYFFYKIFIPVKSMT